MFEFQAIDLMIIVVILFILFSVQWLPSRLEHKHLLISGTATSILGGLLVIKLEPFFTKTIKI